MASKVGVPPLKGQGLETLSMLKIIAEFVMFSNMHFSPKFNILEVN